MPYNDIKHEISPNSWNRILGALATLKAELSFLINLTPQERMELAKMSDGTLAFVTKVMEYMKSHPQFLPSFADKTAFEKDFALMQKLDALFGMLTIIASGVDHTRMAAGSEAYAVARMYYNNVGLAAQSNQPGAGVIRDDLAARFNRKGNGSSGSDPEMVDPTL